MLTGSIEAHMMDAHERELRAASARAAAASRSRVRGLSGLRRLRRLSGLRRLRRLRDRRGRVHVAAPAPGPLTIRRGQPGDAAAIQRLAQLDSRPVPAFPVLVGELGGEPTAVLSLADGAVVADPFRPTAELVSLLAMRAGQLGPAPARRTKARLRRLEAARA